ncbi:MAG: SRPBCC domain-containing protein [Thermoleophilia bacterium]
MSEPLVVEFEVRATPAVAFATWTERIGAWWPRSHTLSREPAAITFEPRAGGRIVERGPDGAEHPWGEVIAWEPPHRVRYWWHLYFDRAEATQVDVTFREHGGLTRVRIEQSGWEALGAAGPPRRERTQQVWGMLSRIYAEHLGAAAG